MLPKMILSKFKTYLNNLVQTYFISIGGSSLILSLYSFANIVSGLSVNLISLAIFLTVASILGLYLKPIKDIIVGLYS
jgi:hypothetical protein